jgi:hypothetical protein
MDPMPKYEQRTIEHFFQEEGVEDADMKARLLPKLTHVIYGYNQSVIKYEAETDAYRKTQIEREIEEIHDKIKREIQNEKEGKSSEFSS